MASIGLATFRQHSSKQVDVGEDVVVRGERIWHELSKVRMA